MNQAHRIQEAERDLPKLRKLAERAITISRKIYQDQPLPPDDYFRQMSLIFLTRQVEHMESILVLTEHKRGRDAGLIARSMLEGLAQLLWADKKQTERGLRWFAFSWLVDWRTMKDIINKGGNIEPAKRKHIEEGMAKYGEQFLKPKGRDKQRQGKPLTKKDYYASWIGGKQMKDLIEEELSYAAMYEKLSAWHHWNPAGFILTNAFVRDGADITFLTSSSIESAISVNTGFQCLLHSAGIVNNYLALDFDSDLEDLSKEHRQITDS